MRPEQVDVLKGMFIPYCSGCGSAELLQAVGIVGAVIMPHNLYLHSALVKTRDVDRKNHEAVKEANKYYFIEASIALFVSFIINVFVVAVFAKGLYGKTNEDVFNICLNKDIIHADVFVNNTDLLDADLYKAGVFLGCQFGYAAMIIWAIGILAAGQSSTMTGTYAGQFVMEGFLNLQWARWKRVLLTRSVAIMPTLFIAIFNGINDLTGMNDILNAIMSLQLPFALIPLLTFTSTEDIMGDFKNGRLCKTVIGLLAVVVIGINFYFVEDHIFNVLINHWAAYLGVAIAVFCYISFLLVMLICSGKIIFGPNFLSLCSCKFFNGNTEAFNLSSTSTETLQKSSREDGFYENPQWRELNQYQHPGYMLNQYF